MKKLGFGIPLIVSICISCGSEWCVDDCRVKMVFVIKNEDASADSIKFGIGSLKWVNLQNSYYPDTNIIHKIDAGGVYVDSFLCNKELHAECACYVGETAKDFLHFRVRQNNAFSRDVPVSPGCANCVNTSFNNTIPESTVVVFTDTLKFSTACITLSGKIVIDSIGFASSRTLKDVDTAHYDPSTDGCLWGGAHLTFHPDDSLTQGKRYQYLSFTPVDSFCSFSSYEKAGFKAGAEFSCVYTGPANSFGSLCDSRFDTPDLLRYSFIQK
jgi:hypothetical protein